MLDVCLIKLWSQKVFEVARLNCLRYYGMHFFKDALLLYKCVLIFIIKIFQYLVNAKNMAQTWGLGSCSHSVYRPLSSGV